MDISNHLMGAMSENLKYPKSVSRFSDITIKVEGKAFPCHKLILSSCSMYFKNILESETSISTFILDDMKAGSFELVLKIIYGGRNFLAENNVADLWDAANQLDIEFLNLACVEYQSERLSINNCVVINKQAKRLGCKELQEKSWDVLVNQFQDVSRSDDFSLIEPDDFLKVIKCDGLNLACEDIVVHAIMKWITYAGDSGDMTRQAYTSQPNNDRKRYITELLKSCRLCLVSARCLQSLIDQKFIIKDRPAFSVVREALRYHLQPESRVYFCPPLALLRNGSQQQNVILTVYKKSCNQDIVSCRDVNDQWFELTSPGLSDTLITSNGYDIYCIGIQKHRSQQVVVNKLDITNGQWALSSQPPVIGKLICFDNFLYLFDITTTTDIFRIKASDSTNRSWQKVGSYSQKVSNVVLTLFGSNIIIFGEEKNSCEITMQCYSTVLDTCTVYEKKLPATTNCSSLVCFQVAEANYVLQGTGELWKILACNEHTINLSSEGEIVREPLNLLSAVVFNEELLITAATNIGCEIFGTIAGVRNIRILDLPGQCLINAVVPKNLVKLDNFREN